MIFTFYSYKGGVGRTMALANVSALYYQLGRNVLIVDWDLEAPGLERFFGYTAESLRSQPGLIDLYNAYLNQSCKLPDIEKYLIDIDEGFLIDAHVKEKFPNRKNNHLWLMHAGKRFGEDENKYILSVRQTDWKSPESISFVDALKDQMNKWADFVLIDSRTGYSDEGGICTYRMADVLVGLCSCTHQSIEGLHKVLSDFKDEKMINYRQKEIPAIVIPSRFEPDLPKVKSFEDKLIQYFQSYYSHINRKDTPLLWQIGIPYQKKFSFEEILIVKEGRTAENHLLYEAYTNIVQLMDKAFYHYDAFIFSDNRDSQSCQELIDQLRQKQISVSGLHFIQQKGGITSEMIEQHLSISKYVIIVWSKNLLEKKSSGFDGFDQMIWEYVVNQMEQNRMIVVSIDTCEIPDVLKSDTIFDFELNNSMQINIMPLIQRIKEF